MSAICPLCDQGLGDDALAIVELGNEVKVHRTCFIAAPQHEVDRVITEAAVVAAVSNELPLGDFCPRCGGKREVPIQGAYGERMVPCPTCRPEESPVVTRGRLDQARAERDEAFKRVQEHAVPATLDRLWDLLMRLLRNVPEISGSDLRAAANEAGIELDEWRAVGPLFLRAERSGYIEDSGRMAPNPLRHAARQVVWRSLLYRPEENA